MKLEYKMFRIAAFATVALLAASLAKADLALIGNKQLAGQTLDADGAKAVLLGKKVTLNGARVVVVIVKSSPAQDQFLQATVGMTTAQFQSHWRRLFMTGGGTAPKLVDNEADAAKTAGETAGAIAIADASAAGDLPVLFSVSK